MRFLGNLLRVGRYALMGLTIMFFGLIAFMDFGNAQTGIPCDPDIPTMNPDCPNGVCRRFDARCHFWLDGYCNDNPEENRRSSRADFLCEWFCSGGRGVCEDSVVPCNMDSDCDPREQCLSGTCSFVEPPDTTPTRDLQCQVDSDCLDSEGCWNNRCTRKCTGTGTGAGCPAGEGCFNGFCAAL